jgi:flagellar motor switch protein FliN
VSQDVTPRDALMRLGASTAEAVAQVLDTFVPGEVERGDVTVLAEGAPPFANLPPGAIASSVSYVNGVTGANIFVLAPQGARRLAAAMGVADSEGDGTAEELSELELSAIAEASNQTMAAAAGAISLVIGQEIQISPPETKVLTSSAMAAEAFGTAPHAISTTFLIAGEACRLIQLVPSAFVVRMVRAIDELGLEDTQGQGGEDNRPAGPATLGLEEALGAIKLRVWAELGRTRLPLTRALGLPVGAVVALDCEAEDPVHLYVNGLRFAQGHLIVAGDGEWGIAIDELTRSTAPAAPLPVAAPPMTSPAATQPEGALN